jgi:hypothetical protein
MKLIKFFIKTCELEKNDEVVHYFENELQERIRIVTDSKEDFEKQKKYKITIEKQNEE